MFPLLPAHPIHKHKKMPTFRTNIAVVIPYIHNRFGRERTPLRSANDSELGRIQVLSIQNSLKLDRQQQNESMRTNINSMYTEEEPNMSQQLCEGCFQERWRG